MPKTQNMVIEKLATHFQNEADMLGLRANNAGIFQNRPDTGDKRENILEVS